MKTSNILIKAKSIITIILICIFSSHTSFVYGEEPFIISDFVSTISDSEYIKLKTILVDETMDFANYLLYNEHETRDGLATDYFFQCAKMDNFVAFPVNRHYRYLQYLKARENTVKELHNGLALTLPPFYQYNILGEKLLNTRVNNFYKNLKNWYSHNKLPAKYVSSHSGVDRILFYEKLRHEIKWHSKDEILNKQ